MKNILSKWNITPEELNQATDELCAKGIAKGCYQNTSALLAAVDLLTAGDIEVEKCLRTFALTLQNVTTSLNLKFPPRHVRTKYQNF